jgi:hypothetical protein
LTSLIERLFVEGRAFLRRGGQVHDPATGFLGFRNALHGVDCNQTESLRSLEHPGQQIPIAVARRWRDRTLAHSERVKKSLYVCGRDFIDFSWP